MKKFFSQLLFGLFAMSTVYANDQNSRWSVTGFGTLGFVGTDTNLLGFYRDRSQMEDVKQSGGMTTDSRLGLQLDGDITNGLHFTAQFVARDHAGDFLEQNLEWAFLRWSPTANLDLRLGRLGADLFLLSDYRNVGYAYPWMRPPHEFYSDLPIYHFDGLDITRKFDLENGSLALKFFAGFSHNQFPSFSQLLNANIAATGGNAVYESGNWRSRVGYAYMHLLSETPTQQLDAVLNDPRVNLLLPNIKNIIPKLSIKDTHINFFSLGTTYDDGIWIAHAEAEYTDTQISLFPDTASGYVSVGRRFSKITLYTLYGIAHSFNKHTNIPKPLVALPQLQQLYQTLDGAINQNGVNEQSISLGARWDILPKVAIKAEWDHFWFGNNGTELWQEPTSGNSPQQTNVWSVGIDFVF